MLVPRFEPMTFYPSPYCSRSYPNLLITWSLSDVLGWLVTSCQYHGIHSWGQLRANYFGVSQYFPGPVHPVGVGRYGFGNSPTIQRPSQPDILFESIRTWRNFGAISHDECLSYRFSVQSAASRVSRWRWIVRCDATEFLASPSSTSSTEWVATPSGSEKK